ncbi:MAG: hypothetical protein ACRDYX_03645 [Egibacteraceae bacterium]
MWSDGREYVVQPGHGGAIRIGDHIIYQGSDAEAVLSAFCEILTLKRLPAPCWLLLAVLDRIAERSRPSEDIKPSSKEIEFLLSETQVRDGEIVLSGEYAVRLGDRGAIRIGDHLYRGSDAEAVLSAFCEILTLKRLPAPRWLLLAVLDRIALRGSHTASDIELLLPALEVRDDGVIVLSGTDVVQPGADGAVHVGDLVYQGSGAEAIRGVLREILPRKGFGLPPWLQLPPTPPTPPTHMSVPGAFALVFGLLALAVCWLPLVGVLALPLGFVAMVTAAVGIHRIRTRATAGLSLAIAGLLTGAIGLVVALCLFFVLLVGFRGPAWQGDWSDVRGLFRSEPR